MSRIGLKLIKIPDKVDVKIENNVVLVKGPNGTLSFEYRNLVKISNVNNEIKIERIDDVTATRSYHGMARSIVNNMIIGVTKGFSKTLLVEGVGYKAEARGNTLVLNVGFSNAVEYVLSKDLKLNVEGGNKITISGTDKQKIGQVSAEIRSIRPPEPYKGKGIRYEGEHIRRKERKSVA